MYEIKVTFDNERELVDFCSKLDLANNFAVACGLFDNRLRSLVKYTSGEEIDKLVRYSSESDSSSLRDAIDYCRKLFNEYLREQKIDLFE